MPSIALGLRNSGTLRIPVGLAPSPYCAPTRPNGHGFAHPVPSCQRFSSVDRYPIGDSRRELEKLKAFENIRQKNILNQEAPQETRPRLMLAGERLITEEDIQWKKLRSAYAATTVDTPEEAAAVANCLNFAESSNHARALCYVGHWYYHGEGGMAQSDRLALAFYEKAAEAGDASAAAARDKMYLAGKGGCEDAINHSEIHFRAVERLKIIATPLGSLQLNSESDNHDGRASSDSANSRHQTRAVSEEDFVAARDRLVKWGYNSPFFLGGEEQCGKHGGGKGDEVMIRAERIQSAKEEKTAQEGKEFVACEDSSEVVCFDDARQNSPSNSPPVSKPTQAFALREISVPPQQQSIRRELKESLKSTSATHPVLAIDVVNEQQRHEILQELRQIDDEMSQEQDPIKEEKETKDNAGNGLEGTDTNYGEGQMFADADAFGPLDLIGPPRRFAPFTDAEERNLCTSVQVQEAFKSNHARIIGGKSPSAESAGYLASSATKEAELSFQCIMASRSYDEYVAMMELHRRVEVERCRQEVAGAKETDIDAHLNMSDESDLLPCDAITYSIFRRDKEQEDRKLTVLSEKLSTRSPGLRLPFKTGHRKRTRDKAKDSRSSFAGPSSEKEWSEVLHDRRKESRSNTLPVGMQKLLDQRRTGAFLAIGNEVGVAQPLKQTPSEVAATEELQKDLKRLSVLRGNRSGKHLPLSSRKALEYSIQQDLSLKDVVRSKRLGQEKQEEIGGDIYLDDYNAVDARWKGVFVGAELGLSPSIGLDHINDARMRATPPISLTIGGGSLDNDDSDFGDRDALVLPFPGRISRGSKSGGSEFMMRSRPSSSSSFATSPKESAKHPAFKRTPSRSLYTKAVPLPDMARNTKPPTSF